MNNPTPAAHDVYRPINKGYQSIEADYARNITFVLTEDCQLRCKYCYICGKNTFKVLNFDLAKKCIDSILEDPKTLKEDGVIWDFIGGEPFLEIKLLGQICDYIKQKMYELNHPWFNKFRFTMSTNGLLYSDPNVQDFISRNHAHLSVGISVDGTKEKHDMQRVYIDGRGCYDDVAANVSLWQSQFNSPTKATIGHDDLSLIKDSVLHLWNLGIPVVNMNVIFENVWEEGDDEIFEKQLVELADIIIENKLYKKYQTSLYDRSIGFEYNEEFLRENWCGTGRRMLAFNTDGQCHPCIRFAQYSLSNQPEILIGDYLNGVNPNKLRPFLALNTRVQSSLECLQCEVATGCAWCQGHNYDTADTETIYQRATYICRMHKARVRANNYYWNKLDKFEWRSETDMRNVRLKERKGMQSLFVLADSAAPSFCHYPVRETERQKMSVETLKKVVYYALTHNLSLNVIAGKEPLDAEFLKVLEECQHVILRPVGAAEEGQTVSVLDFETDTLPENVQGEMLVLRIEAKNLEQLPAWLEEHSLKFARIQMFVKDMENVGEEELTVYQNVLQKLVGWLPEREEKKPLELSFLTDRLILEKPNHCGAGVKHVTVAPDGVFYVCPGFYYREKNRDFVISDIDTVLKTHELPIKNGQLYRLDHAPICENCDAWHCKRCVFLNKETTLEVNTPSRQQCVMAHLERNAARELIEPLFLTEEVSIPEIDYLDPFDELMKKKNPSQNQKEEC